MRITILLRFIRLTNCIAIAWNAKKKQTNKPNNKQNKQNKRNKTKHKTKQNPKTHFCLNIAYLPGGPWIKEKLEVSAFLMALVWLSL